MQAFEQADTENLTRLLTDDGIARNTVFHDPEIW